MKQVGIREAQTQLTTLLNDLPFSITRYGTVIAVVSQPEENVTVTPEVPVPKVTVTRPNIQELRDKIAGIPAFKPKPEWGNASLKCQFCGVSPAVMFNYEDENGEELQAYVCQTHLQGYQKSKSQSTGYGVVRSHYSSKPGFNPVPKPPKKEKKERKGL